MPVFHENTAFVSWKTHSFTCTPQDIIHPYAHVMRTKLLKNLELWKYLQHILTLFNEKPSTTRTTTRHYSIFSMSFYVTDKHFLALFFADAK